MRYTWRRKTIYGVIPDATQMYIHLITLARTFIFKKLGRVEVLVDDRASGGCGERNVPTHHQDARLMETAQCASTVQQA